MTEVVRLVCASLLAVTLSTPAATAAVVNLDTAPAGAYYIQTEQPGFGSEGPVTLDWDPLSDAATSLIRWTGSDYSGRHAAYCQGGLVTSCALDLLVDATHSITLSSFFLGGWPDTDRVMDWSVLDLATWTPVVGALDVLVSGATGLTVTVGATSTAGFRILFGPDGFDGGINDISYSYTRLNVPPPPPSAVPLPAAGWLLLAGLGGLVALRRRYNG